MLGIVLGSACRNETMAEASLAFVAARKNRGPATTLQSAAVLHPIAASSEYRRPAWQVKNSPRNAGTQKPEHRPRCYKNYKSYYYLPRCTPSGRKHAHRQGYNCAPRSLPIATVQASVTTSVERVGRTHAPGQQRPRWLQPPCCPAPGLCRTSGQDVTSSETLV